MHFASLNNEKSRNCDPVVKKSATPLEPTVTPIKSKYKKYTLHPPKQTFSKQSRRAPRVHGTLRRKCVHQLEQAGSFQSPTSRFCHVEAQNEENTMLFFFFLYNSRVISATNPRKCIDITLRMNVQSINAVSEDVTKRSSHRCSAVNISLALFIGSVHSMAHCHTNN